MSEIKLDWLTKHIREIFLGAMTGILIWMANMLLEVRENQLTETGRLEALIKTVSDHEQAINQIVSSRYSNQDAERDQRISELERDKLRLEIELKEKQ